MMLCCWDRKMLFWCLSGLVPGLGSADMIAAIQAAWSAWSSVCGVSGRYTACEELANIRFVCCPLVVSTLAYAQIPTERHRGPPLEVRLNSVHVWNQALLERVAVHELGHAAVGLHAHSDEPGSAMNGDATKERRITEADAAEAVKRYGMP